MRWILAVAMLVIGLGSITNSAKQTNMTVNRNVSRPYSLRVNKYLCVLTPYKRSHVPYCKTILRRNKPTMLNVSVVVPEVLNYIWVTVKLYYKFKIWRPFLIDMEQEGCEYIKNRPIIPLTDYIYETYKHAVPDLATPCPHGNRTYSLVWQLEDRHTPDTMPAGDYRLDTRFIAKDGVLIFAVEAYFTVRRSGILPSMIEW